MPNGVRKTITKAQIRKLRTVASKTLAPCRCGKGQPDAACEYHAFLLDNFEVTSTKHLSRAQATRAIDALEGKRVPAQGPEPTPSRGQPDPDAAHLGRYESTGAKTHATQKQLDEIARLEDLLGWTGALPLQRMIRRQTGRADNIVTLPHLLSRAQATSLITGMRRLRQHKTAA
jgi:hypothetical protein